MSETREKRSRLICYAVRKSIRRQYLSSAGDGRSRTARPAVGKPPGIAEAIDWLAALRLVEAERLDEQAADRTLGAVLKYREDQELVRAQGLERLGRT